MAFKLAQTEKFRTPVTVNIPNETGGFDKNTFTVIFLRPTTRQIKDLSEMRPTDEELLRKYMVGWEMTDVDSNESVPFNTENFEAFLAISSAPGPTASALIEAARGARSKN